MVMTHGETFQSFTTIEHASKSFHENVLQTLKIHKPSTSLNEHLAGLGVWV